jgi:quercetin dioxygenase-like cupin family protein
MKSIALVFACACLALPAKAQQQSAQTPPSGFILKQVVRTLPKGDQLEMRVRTSTFQPGQVSDWHIHPTPVATYVVEGTLFIEMKDGTTMQAKAGEAFIDPGNVVLRGSNRGDTAAKLVFFQVSPPDSPFADDPPSK